MWLSNAWPRGGDDAAAPAEPPKTLEAAPRVSPSPSKQDKAPLRDRTNAPIVDEVCDIDKRLHALQAFLKEAKSKPL